MTLKPPILSQGEFVINRASHARHYATLQAMAKSGSIRFPGSMRPPTKAQTQRLVTMAAAGKTKDDYMQAVSIDIQQYDRWVSMDPDFHVADRKARDLRLAWFKHTATDAVVVSHETPEQVRAHIVKGA